MPIALAAHFGALGIPRNDDWAYVLAAFGFEHTGTVSGYHWASMNLVGQLVLSAPVVWLFGDRIAPLQIEVAAFGVVGLVAAADLARHLLSRAQALFVAVVVAVGPMWASLSASFMTDIPAFALGLVCLAPPARAVQRERISVPYLAASLFAGFLGFAVREYGLVAPLAVGIVAVLTATRISRRLALQVAAALLIVLLAGAALVVWRHSLPGFVALTPRLPTLAVLGSAAHMALQSALLVGLLTAPAVCLAGPIRLVKTPRALWLTLLGAIIILRLTTGPAFLRNADSALGPGNYVLPNGTLGTIALPGIRPDLLPSAIYTGMAIVGALSIAIVLCAAGSMSRDAVARSRERPRPQPVDPAMAIVGFAAIGTAAVCVGGAIAGLNLFDRYLLPLVPLVSIMILYQARHGRRRARHTVLAGSGLLALAVVGVMFAANSASFEGTTWTVAKAAARSANGAGHVDGGFDWDNFHAQVPRYGTTSRACIKLFTTDQRPSSPGPILARHVWSPIGHQSWIVAIRTTSCG